MKILIVGCGWLGQQLAVQLQADGHQVIATRRTAEALGSLPAAVEGVVLDLLLPPDFAALKPLFSGAVVICAIAPGRQTAGSNYVVALQQLAALAVAAGSKQLIHFSSSGIYQGLTGIVDETASLLTADDRVALLLQGEQALQQELPCLTLRLAGLMGPGRHPGRFTAGKQLADPDGPVNMLHSRDLIAAVQQLLAALPCSETYNLSSPETESRADFYQVAYRLAGVEPVGFNQQAAARKVVSTKFCHAFGYSYRFALASAALAYCD
uniref:Protein yeeZ n=1 Tax=Rheinheimera sp. BAL341 TaxID=1708203 RepID=A0A486XKY6_9GAMM